MQSKNKKIASALVSLVVISGAIALVWKLTSKPVAAAWFDDNWGYRTIITIGNSGAAVTNQKVKLDIDTAALITAGKMQADCGDTRFTNPGGDLLEYYLDSTGGACNTSSTDYYVLLPTIPSGSSLVYHYYGNPAATNGTVAAQFSQTTFSPTSGPTSGSEEKGSGPVAYWKFDEGTGTTAKDSTPNNNFGTFGATTAAPTWQTEDQCISGKCLKFDGSNDEISIGDRISVSGATGLTLSAWVKPNAIASSDFNTIFFRGTSAGTRAYSLYLGSSDEIRFRVTTSSTGTSSSVNLDTTTSPISNLNRWYFITAVYSDTDDTMRIYVNGNQVTSNGALTSGTLADGASSTYVGRTADTLNPLYFNGFIDEPKIYNYPRTVAQVKSDYISRGSGKGTSSASIDKVGSTLSNGLVGYWKMDESAANSCSGGVNDNCDSSGNGVDGAWTSTFTSAAGKFGNAGSFDGGTRYADMGDPTAYDFGANNFSVSAWAYRNSGFGSYDTIVASKWNTGSSPGTNEWSLASGACGAPATDTFPCFGIESGSTSYSALSPDATSDNTWYHYVGVRDGSNLKLYVDGVLKKSVEIGNVSVNNISGRTVKIAKIDGGVYGLNGRVDEVRIYNRALPQTEVQQLYSWAPGPIGYWKFDEKTGTSAFDSSGNANTGTLNNSPVWSTGKYGAGLLFSRTNTTGVTASPSKTGRNYATISGWVNFDDPDNLNNLDQYHWLFGWPTEFNLIFRSYTSQPGAGYFIRADALGSNAFYGIPNKLRGWHHVASTYNGTEIRIYFDGVSVSSQSVSGSLSNNGRSFYIGGNFSDVMYYFDGAIDDVKYYNYARTPNQILEDMGNGPAERNPVGYWKFDEGYGTIANDISGNNLVGTITNMASPATSTSGWTNSGKFNKALIFDGAASLTDYVQVANKSTLNLNGSSMSMSAWVNIASLPVADPIIMGKSAVADGNTGKWYMYVHAADNTFRSGFYDGTDWNCNPTSTTSLSTGTWYHLATTFDGNSAKLYINGKLSGSEIGGDCAMTLSDATSGYFNFSPSGFRIAGTIDEGKVYNYALTQEDINLEYNQAKTEILGVLGNNTSYAPNSSNQEYCVPGDSTSCAGPVAEWKLEERTGTITNDSSGYGNTSSAFSGNASWTTGKFGSGIAFDGTDDAVLFPETTATDLGATTDSYTISAWVKTNTDFSATAAIVEKRSAATYPARLTLDSSERPVFSIRQGANAPTASSATSIRDNQWHYVTAVRDVTGDTLYLYVDGILKGSANDTTTATTVNNDSWSIGTDAGLGDDFQGSVDQVRIYNYARTQAQVAWEYNQGKPIGHWKMDECQGTTINDASGNGNVGTWSGSGGGTQTAAGTCTTASTAWGNGATGRFNSSLNFDGTDDYVNLGTTDALNLTSSLTISSWIKTTSFGAAQIIFSRRSAGNNGYSASITNSTTLTFTQFGVVSYPVTINQTLATDTWYNLTYVYDAPNQLFTIYVNGTLAGSTSVPTTTISTPGTETDIGRNAIATFAYFSGQIDDTRLYNYPLTATQAQQVYNQGSAVRFGPATGSP